MSAGATAYLVVRRDDGFGDVVPLTPGQTCTLGRAASNRIVLKDDLCSREHAEISADEEGWRVRDLNSLNGTRVNGAPSRAIAAGPQRRSAARPHVFPLRRGHEPAARSTAPGRAAEGVNIKKRLGQTRFLTPAPAVAADDSTTTAGPPPRHALSRDLSLLYRLALDMGSAADYEELCGIVLDALLEAIPAEVGAILTVTDGEPPRNVPAPIPRNPGAAVKSLRGADLEVTAHRHRDPSIRSYSRVSEYVSNEVLDGREAILAEDVARDRHLRNRESLSEMAATSLICAPVLHADRCLA